MNTTSHQQTNTDQPLDRRLVDILEKTRATEREAMARLEVLNARIGTPDAQPNDFEATIATIHQLMSVLQVYMGIPCEETARATLWMERRKRLREASKQ